MAMKTAPVLLTQELRNSLVQLGNYSHPIFHYLAVAQSSGMPALPLPGQGLLLIAGGAVEESGIVKDAIALVGLGETKFVKPAFTGDEIVVEIKEESRTLTSAGKKAIAVFTWEITNGKGELLATTTARMLLHA
jgi:acyl dehydratase